MAIRCASCGYENDPTRVYCHNCAGRLERGPAVPPPPTGYTHPTDAVSRRSRRSSIAWGSYFGFLVKLSVLGGLVTVLVLALWPPRNLPPTVEPDKDLAARLSGLLRDASSAGSARSFAVPAADVQRWLVTSTQLGSSAGLLSLDPQRVYVVLGDGIVRVGLQAKVSGVADLYFEGDFAAVSEGSGYRLRPLRYSVGRLLLPLAVSWPVASQMEVLGEALATPLAQLSKASYVGVSPDAVTLRWAAHSP